MQFGADSAWGRCAQRLPSVEMCAHKIDQEPRILATGGKLKLALVGCSLLEGKVPELLAALTAAVGFREDASVRIAGLQCLASAMNLPYTALHAHVRGVNKLLSQALDDPKRAVRSQAGRTRKIWNPM